jgi:hypothetical protein
MTRDKAFVVIAITTALGILGTASAAASDRDGRGVPRGYVVPCSLNGVNSVYPPDIFGDPAAARSFGFVRSRDGVWHVIPNCNIR